MLYLRSLLGERLLDRITRGELIANFQSVEGDRTLKPRIVFHIVAVIVLTIAMVAA